MFIFFAPVIIFLLVGVYFDITTGRIPNWLTLPGALVGLLVAFVDGGAEIFLSHFMSLIILGGAWFLLWQLGMMGGGDQKLMMLVGAWTDQSFALPILVSVAVCGGLQSLVYVFRRRHRDPTLTWRHALRGTRLPYSLAIALGTALIISYFVIGCAITEC